MRNAAPADKDRVMLWRVIGAQPTMTYRSRLPFAGATRTTPTTAAAMLLVSAWLATGCVRAEGTQYQRHLTTLIEPEKSPPANVALGVRDEKPLDEPAQPVKR